MSPQTHTPDPSPRHDPTAPAPKNPSAPETDLRHAAPERPTAPETDLRHDGSKTDLQHHAPKTDPQHDASASNNIERDSVDCPVCGYNFITRINGKRKLRSRVLIFTNDGKTMGICPRCKTNLKVPVGLRLPRS